ncbi:MAG: glycosyltransferase family 9 protein [Planctomycetota bacterium]|nr:MAG: glycosyltransferase family 9 protein [Planctomycetota bacterium]KAB2943845.1 MAG: glycosyltransferase family 9 protein [Phycisphaerae bacterium]
MIRPDAPGRGAPVRQAGSTAVTALKDQNFERILLIKPSSLGDVVHALPVLSGLRGRYPAARIDWLVAPAFAPLLVGNPALTEVVLFDRSRFGRVGRSLAVTREFARFLGDLRARRYDLVVDLQGLFRSAAIARATGAAVRVGFRGAREGAPFFYTHRVATPLPDEHAVDKNLRVLASLSARSEPVEFCLALTDSDRRTARQLLQEGEAGAELGERPWVAVVPGARWETKEWSESGFAAVIDVLTERGVVCVLIGAAAERERCARIAASCRKSPLNLAGRTDVRLMSAVIEQADVVLCQDSAPMHIAVALNRPLVCLMGPTSPARTGPYRRSEDILRLDLDCSPCFLRRLRQCPHAHRCMKDLSFDRVVEAVIERLG